MYSVYAKSVHLLYNESQTALQTDKLWLTENVITGTLLSQWIIIYEHGLCKPYSTFQ